MLRQPPNKPPPRERRRWFPQGPCPRSFPGQGTGPAGLLPQWGTPPRLVTCSAGLPVLSGGGIWGGDRGPEHEAGAQGPFLATERWDGRGRPPGASVFLSSKRGPEGPRARRCPGHGGATGSRAPSVSASQTSPSWGRRAVAQSLNKLVTISERDGGVEGKASQKPTL